MCILAYTSGPRIPAGRPEIHQNNVVSGRADRRSRIIALPMTAAERILLVVDVDQFDPLRRLSEVSTTSIPDRLVGHASPSQFLSLAAGQNHPAIVRRSSHGFPRRPDGLAPGP